MTWLTAALSQASNVLNDVAARAFSLPDFAGTLLGLRSSKRLRLSVVVLRDEEGEPLADASQAAAAVARASEILDHAAGVRLVPRGDGPLVRISDMAAPAAALDVGCNLAAWREDLGAAGAHFRSLALTGVAGTPFGYGTPLTVLVVRSIGRWSGCSIGPLASYVTVTAGTIHRGDGRTLAHELGHACLLLHRRDAGNLMAPAKGDRLTRWQAAVTRSSSHVTYF
jgi:hypothetical protein